MATIPTSIIPDKYSTPLFLVLTAFGLAGNYYNYPLLHSVAFIFGSIFAMLALQFFGLGRGVLAAAIISSYTYFLWNHPYAIITMTAEVAAVGWLMGRRKMGMVLADALYWLLIGMPLVYLLYHFVMHLPSSQTTFFMVKQAVNGIANALVARLLYACFALRTRSSLTSYREIIYNLLAFFVLCPALLMLAVDSRSDFKETESHIRTTLIQDSNRVTDRLETWVLNRKSAITNLAEMAASKSPQQMQPYLEQAKKSDVNFLRVGALDKNATSTAFYPLLDELGQNNIGKNFADRPFIPQLKRELKPMLSEVVMGRIGTPKPIVAVLAPVLIAGEYGGYVAGILSMEQVREHLDKSSDHNIMLYTLLDKNGNVIMTNRADQTVMTPFDRGKGTLNRLDKMVSQWVPVVTPDTPYFDRWKQSFYVVETVIGDLAEWKLILEQPASPSHRLLYHKYSGRLITLSLILFVALALAELLSRQIVAALNLLRTLTYELPARLATPGKDIIWPESGIKEANHLINNFREMADSLSGQFFEVKQINESLEKRVEERTTELDITNKELIAEIEERKQAEESLRKSEVLYHSLVETSQDLIWQCDAEGRFTYLNLAWEHVLGYELDEMLGKKFRDFQNLDTAECELIDFNRWMEDHSVDHYETMFKGKSGNEIHLVLNAIIISDKSGNIVGASGTAYDITERKLMEVELHQAKAAAEAASIAKSRFLATMSHEIRTPMNGVIGMMQLLQHSELTPEQHEYAESAIKSGVELVHLLNDILDLSKIEANKIELEKSDFDLRPVISDVMNLLLLSAAGKGVELDSSFDADVPTALKGDAGRLRQIVTNLVGNAIKFTPKGSVKLHIQKIDEDEHTTTLRFLVVDSGIGIAAEKLDHIFEPFTQADSSTTRTYGGTGLGLAICKQLVELMGGAIGVESVAGEGTTFWFTVVLEKADKISIPDPCPFGEVTKVSIRRVDVAGGPPIRILLTDDDPIARKIVPNLLKTHGYLVDVAADGKEALQLLEENDYALVLLDCMMPEMSGYEVTVIIRNPASNVRNHNIPVIALTGNAMQQDRDECIAAGMNDHLPKPLILNDLLAVLEKWLKI
ncbi:MAG: response regulator [Geobacteraceae bacterium]|nr:response regulator [Geobacteraceae bacterium]NTW80586.1 response regulator [Geobacteraceae bacterium]